MNRVVGKFLIATTPRFPDSVSGSPVQASLCYVLTVCYTASQCFTHRCACFLPRDILGPNPTAQKMLLAEHLINSLLLCSAFIIAPVSFQLAFLDRAQGRRSSAPGRARILPVSCTHAFRLVIAWSRGRHSSPLTSAGCFFKKAAASQVGPEVPAETRGAFGAGHSPADAVAQSGLRKRKQGRALFSSGAPEGARKAHCAGRGSISEYDQPVQLEETAFDYTTLCL